MFQFILKFFKFVKFYVILWLNRIYMLWFVKSFILYIFKYINSLLFFLSGFRNKTNFINNSFLQIGDFFFRDISKLRKNSIDFVTEEENNGKKYEKFYFKEYIKDYSASFPLYKIFFTLNKGLFATYKFSLFFANRIIQPFSGFFETFYRKRLSYFRYNFYPRKLRKERMVNFNLIFLKRFLFFKIKYIFNFFFIIVCFLFFIFFKLKFLVLSMIFSILILYNNFMFLFFLKYLQKKMKKIRVALNLIAFKNYNVKNNSFLVKGIPAHFKEFSQVDLNRITKQISIFLDNEIYKLFSILAFKFKLEKNMKKNKNIKNDLKRKKILKFHTFLKRVLIKKILNLNNYLFYWRLYEMLGFFFTIGIDKVTGERPPKKFRKFFQKFNLVFDYVYGVSLFRTKNPYLLFHRSFMIPFLEKFRFFYPSLFLFGNKIKNMLKIFFLERFKSKTLKNLAFRQLLFLLNKKLNLIQNTSNDVKQMLFFLDIFNKRSFSFKIESLNLEFVVHLNKDLKNICFKDTLDFDIFLDFFFFTKQEFSFFGVNTNKYIILIENEKKIFEIERYLNKFDFFIDELLGTYVLKFSKEDRNQIILKNKEFFILEKCFKEVFVKCNSDFNFDDSRFTNDNLHEFLLYVMKDRKKELNKNLRYRDFLLTNSKLVTYNIANFGNLFNELKTEEKLCFRYSKERDELYKYLINDFKKDLILNSNDKFFEIFYKKSHIKDDHYNNKSNTK